jgi:hypothetical protein
LSQRLAAGFTLLVKLNPCSRCPSLLPYLCSSSSRVDVGKVLVCSPALKKAQTSFGSTTVAATESLFTRSTSCTSTQSISWSYVPTSPSIPSPGTTIHDSRADVADCVVAVQRALRHGHLVRRGRFHRILAAAGTLGAPDGDQGDVGVQELDGSVRVQEGSFRFQPLSEEQLPKRVDLS